MSPLVIFQVRLMLEGLLTDGRTGEIEGRTDARAARLGARTLSHIWQANGRSLLWTRSCFFKSGARMKDLPQTSHLYGLKPVWIFRCSGTDGGVTLEAPASHPSVRPSGRRRRRLLTFEVSVGGEGFGADLARERPLGRMELLVFPKRAGRYGHARGERGGRPRRPPAT